MISITLKQLSKSYGQTTVIRNISLTHNAGILGIAGSNGSGKSTLLKCMAGLLQPNSGCMIWEKENKKLSQSALQSCMGYAAPYISLYRELSVQENLEFLSKLRKLTLRQRELSQLLALVGIEHAQHQLYGKLSTGQQQRVRLASSLFHNPFILLLDEPGSNLDQKGRSLIQSLTKKFKAENKLMVIASNDPQELDLCDRIFSVKQESFI